MYINTFVPLLSKDCIPRQSLEANKPPCVKQEEKKRRREEEPASGKKESEEVLIGSGGSPRLSNRPGTK